MLHNCDHITQKTKTCNFYSIHHKIISLLEMVCCIQTLVAAALFQTIKKSLAYKMFPLLSTQWIDLILKCREIEHTCQIQHSLNLKMMEAHQELNHCHQKLEEGKQTVILINFVCITRENTLSETSLILFCHTTELQAMFFFYDNSVLKQIS